MSMELHVLSDQRLQSITEWQRALDDEHYPLRLAPDVVLSFVGGLLPSTLSGKPTGFECYNDDPTKTMESLGREHFGHRWRFALGLRWRGDFDELQAAWMAATAYVTATAGVIFDHETAKVLTPEQGRKMVAEIMTERPRAEAVMTEIMRKLATENR